MNRIAAWLCEANKGQSGAEGAGNKDEGYAAVTKRAMKFRAGYGSAEDPDWVSFAYHRSTQLLESFTVPSRAQDA